MWRETLIYFVWVRFYCGNKNIGLTDSMGGREMAPSAGRDALVSCQWGREVVQVRSRNKNAYHRSRCRGRRSCHFLVQHKGDESNSNYTREDDHNSDNIDVPWNKQKTLMVIATRNPKMCSVFTKIHHGKKEKKDSTVCLMCLCRCAELLRPSNKHRAHLTLDLQAVPVLPRVHRQLPFTHVGVTLKLLLQVLRRTRADSDTTEDPDQTTATAWWCPAFYQQPQMIPCPSSVTAL